MVKVTSHGQKNVEGYSTSNGSEQKEKHSGSLKNNNLAAHKKNINHMYIYIL
jgi:hypothetical protein